MAAPANPPLIFVRGDDETVIVVICSDAAGVVPVDISGRTYQMSVEAPGATVITKTGSVVGATGTVTFVFTVANTTSLTANSSGYDVVETASGAASTIILGTITMLAAVTP